MIIRFDPKKYRKDVDKDSLELLAILLAEDGTSNLGEDIKGESKIRTWKSRIFLSKFVNN